VITILPVYWRTLNEHKGNTSHDRYLLLCDVTMDMENTASSTVMLDRVYKAVAWLCIDQIHYNMSSDTLLLMA
jgi:hypothetical protein